MATMKMATWIGMTATQIFSLSKIDWQMIIFCFHFHSHSKQTNFMGSAQHVSDRRCSRTQLQWKLHNRSWNVQLWYATPQCTRGHHLDSSWAPSTGYTARTHHRSKLHWRYRCHATPFGVVRSKSTIFRCDRHVGDQKRHHHIPERQARLSSHFRIAWHIIAVK